MRRRRASDQVEAAMKAHSRHTISTLLVLALVALSLASDPVSAISRQVRGTTNTNVNRNLNANRSANVNVNRDINVNRNVNVNVDRGGYCCYHPIATAAAVTAAAVT